MRPVTPRGFRDVMPAEAAEREVVARRFSEAFAAWGYEPVETPVVERLDALESAVGSLDDAFRLLDVDGRLLALRPDMTLPIARLVAARLTGEPGPFRFRYAAEVFREHESLRGQAREFSQVGVELVGAGGPAADAEMIAMLVEGLQAAGLTEFTVSIGTVAVFNAIVEAAGAPESWGAAVFSAAHEGNLVELDRLAAEPAVAREAGRALRKVPRIRGGFEAIGQARDAAVGCSCDTALDELAETWRLLDSAGVSDFISIDFSVMRSFDYYTGLVAEAYVPGLGVPLGGGGRYDGVLAAYGAPRPSAGFALGMERVMIALVEQAGGVRVRGLDAVVGGEAAVALRAASELRQAGWRVAISARSGAELVREAERLGAVEALIVRADGAIVRLDRAGEPATPLEDPVPYAPTTSWAQGGDAE